MGGTISREHFDERQGGCVMATDTSSDTALDRNVDHRLDDGDHEKFAHYVNKTEMTRSAVTGEAITALCGKTWVPSRDGEQFPVCPACKEIYATAKSLGN
ncbi:MAG: hypothetical protein ACI8Y4_001208 [Candidatus Poriferisodalaceae bacterium]